MTAATERNPAMAVKAVRDMKSGPGPVAREAEAPHAGQRPANNTRSRILDAGERLVQVRGFNGFSYADVAAELSLTKASLHYHFPSKAELGEALIARYAERFARALADIDANVTLAPAKLDAY